ncbi:MAG: hypothetical protein ACYTHJ_11275 [Planctomycetota bacterium]
MRGKGLNNWRPGLGVAVAGVLAFSWALQGAYGDPAGIAKRSTPAAASADVEEGLIVELSTALPISGVRSLSDRDVFEATGPAQGGVAGAEECFCDLDCRDGDPCTVNTCVGNVCQSSTADAIGELCEDGDGDFCTNGACDDSGNCVGNGAGDSCDVDEVCNSGTANCDGTECATDGECTASNDPDNCISGVCDGGRCVGESDCTDAELCDGAGTCELVADGRCCSDPEACTLTALADCDGGNGPWSSIWDCDCPKYSSGENQNAGNEFLFLLTADEPDACVNGGFSRVGDDYTIANSSYLEMSSFRFVGGPTLDGTGNGVMVFEIWDGDPALANPVLVAGFAVAFTGLCEGGDNDGGTCGTDADCPNGDCNTAAVIRGSRFWTITLGAPATIPPIGYFVVRPGAGSAETVGILSTNDVGLIGSNNPDLLFTGNGDTGPVLSPDNPDILAFELLGAKIDPPTGSCCLGEGQCVDDGTGDTVWKCDELGGTFVPGATCLDDPCGVATCCFGDGGCQVLAAGDCTGAGGEVGVFGGSCDPNCCVQPFTGADDCGGGVATVLDTANTQLPIVARFSGDSTDATNGTCSGSGDPCRTFQADGEDCPAGETCNAAPGACTIGGTDQGWFESFTITSNANVEIGYCCTDPDSPAAPGFRWIVMVDDCEGCSTTARDTDGDPPVQGCADGQPADIWSGLSAGTYNYSVFADRYCQNSPGFTNCTGDVDCPEGEGPCITQAGPYEILVTATALPDQACCLGSVCIDTVDAIECEEQDGYSVPDTPLCIPINPCLLGACCLGAGDCQDNGGDGINQGDCEANPTGQYIGGARCADDPCPVCEIEDDTNCQTNTGNFIVQNDRAVWNPPDEIDRWADDFRVSATAALDRICWWPAFFNPDQGTECSAPGEPPADNWQMTIYNDNGGLPGSIASPTQTITPDAKVSLGAASRVWLYSAPVDAPPVLTADQCYWMEITGEGEGQGGCRTYWLLSGDGNSYSLNDLDGNYGAEDILTEIAGDTAVDLAFCVNMGLGGSAGDELGCGDIFGACCNPDLTCTNNVELADCIAAGGVFNPGSTCEPGLCPNPCETPPGNGLESCPGAIYL